MKKRRIHQLWVGFRRIKPSYFLILFIISGVVCIFALRSNNQNMIKLRNNVYQADKDNTDVNGALQALRVYVYAHMNTNLASGPNAVYPPIQLKYTFERLQAAEQQQVNETNTALYTNAEDYCQATNPVGFSGRTRVPCIEAYVESHGANATPIAPGLYEFDFVSPSWSPDLAGWSLVTTVFLLVVYVISLGAKRLSGGRPAK